MKFYMSEQDNVFLDRLFKHPILVIMAIGLVTAFFAFQLPRAEIDNNNMRFVPANDEALLTNNYIEDNFGSSFFILVALERRYSDVFDAAFLNRIREFNHRMEDFEMVGNINSLVSSDFIFAESDPGGYGSIVVEKLSGEDFSGTNEEIAALRQRLLSWDIYRRSLISDDFKATQILIPLEISSEQASQPEFVDEFLEIRDIAKEMFQGYAEVYVTGLPIISAVINEAMEADLVTMVPLVVLVVLIMLFFGFRKITFMLLPIITVLVAVIWTMGAMPVLGIKLSVITTVLPVILVAVGSAYGIHMATHYLIELKVSGILSNDEHRAIVLGTLRKIGKAVFLAALTTMAGFFSFCFTSVIPIREFGIFATLGVLFTFILAVTLIPALLIMKGPPRVISRSQFADAAYPQPHSKDWPPAHVLTDIAAGKKGLVIFTLVLLACFSVWGFSKLVIDNIFVDYFKTTTDIYRSDRFVRERFGGSKVVNLVVQADSTEALFIPEILLSIDRLVAYLEEEISEVGKVMGFTDLIKRINQVFNADESPEGLSPGLNPGRSSFDDDFGFGFGDFGFDFVDSFEEPIYAASDYAETPPMAVNQEPLNTGELVSILREAASAGRNRSLDANSLVRELERLVNYEGMAYYEIPADPARYGMSSPEELSRLVANYLILLSANISSYANDPLSPTAINTLIQLRTRGNIDTDIIIGIIQSYINDNFPADIKTTIGGPALVESSLNRLVVESQIISVLISIIVVFMIITISNRSFIAGFMGITPLSICILLNFALMGFFGITLNIGTSMMASLCVGIGIDYAIHYMEAYKREYRAARDSGGGDFLLKTFLSSGRAIIINAMSVGAGFAVLLFSQFVMLKDLGLLVAFTMALSALVSLTVLPVLLSIVKPKFITREK